MAAIISFMRRSPTSARASVPLATSRAFDALSALSRVCAASSVVVPVSSWSDAADDWPLLATLWAAVSVCSALVTISFEAALTCPSDTLRSSTMDCSASINWSPELRGRISTVRSPPAIRLADSTMAVVASSSALTPSRRVAKSP